MISTLLLLAGVSLAGDAAADDDAESAYRKLVKRCEGGDAAACLTAGRAAAQGTRVPFDKIASTELLTRACDGGDLDGCVHLGWTYIDHRGTWFLPERAGPLWESACAQGHDHGCYSWGRFLMAPDYGGYDPERAGQVFEQSCQQGNAKGCLWLGRLSWRGRGRPVDHERARALFRQACDAGEEAACADLGLMLELGHGGPPELLRAEAIYREGCMDSGHPQLCARLALLVVKGQPIRLDQPAVDLLSRAARSADPAGRVGLGLAWIDGLGGAAPDPERGWLLLGDACDLDGASRCDLTGCTYEEALACHVLAVREEGRPGSDPTLVQRLRRAACDNGVTDACALLEAAPAGE